jgi:branched-subunit amino acid ABC-type transport system permease component
MAVVADIPVWDWVWAWWVDRSSWQLVFNGMIIGLVYGLIGMGVVLIYRSTRVINLAVGNMGLPAMGLMAIMVVNYNFPYWIALLVALAVGTIGGGVLELAVVRRLFDAPRVIVLVATIGIAQLMQAILFALPDAKPESGEGFPIPLGSEWEPFWGIEVEGPDLTILVMVPLLAIGLSVFLNRTVFGQTVQASATNADLARLQGINPRTVSLFVWTVAGFLAAAAMIMLAGRRGEATGIQNLGPVTMTRALAAAVIGGMFSFRRTVAAGIALGLLQTHIVRIHLGDPGLFDFVLFVLVVAAIVRHRGARPRRPSLSSSHLRPHRRLRRVRAVGDGDHRLVGPGVARPDGVRRVRGPIGRGVQPWSPRRRGMGRRVPAVRPDLPRPALRRLDHRGRGHDESHRGRRGSRVLARAGSAARGEHVRIRARGAGVSLPP